MVKAYLKYEQAAAFGVVASSSAGAIALPSSGRAALIAAPAVDAVVVWNLRAAARVVSLSNAATRRAGTITSLALAPDGTTLAAGYSDGSIRVWAVPAGSGASSNVPWQQRQALANTESTVGSDQPELEPIATFNGHRSAISSLCFMLSPISCGESSGKKRKELRSSADDRDAMPSRLASGSNDGDVILWDLVGEAGLFRTMAHNDAVTSIKLLAREPSPIIISASKDGLVRIYDVESQHCVQTIVGHHAEVWTMEVDPSHSILVTGSVDADLRVFRFKSSNGSSNAVPNLPGSTNMNDGDNSDLENGIDVEAVLLQLGAVRRTTAAGRVVDMCIRRIRDQTFMSVCGADKSAELFSVRSPVEADQHRKRRRQRRAEKARKVAAATAAVGDDEAKAAEEYMVVASGNGDDVEAVIAKDYIVSVRAYKTPSRVRSVVFADTEQLRAAMAPTSTAVTSDVHVVMQLNNNALEMHSIRVAAKKKKRPRTKQKKRQTKGGDEFDDEDEDDVDDNDEDGDHTGRQSRCHGAGGDEEPSIGAMKRISTLESGGHRGDVRSIALSPDDTALFTASRKSAKIWNMATGKCIRTMATSGSSLCTSFLGADARLAAVGSKEGALEVFDLGTGELVTSVPAAHSDAIWSMSLDNRIYESATLVTGGADKCVRFWDFSQTLATAGKSRDLKLLRTLELPDEVLSVCVAYGREQPVVIASLMDSTVRAFDLTSLDPYMSFYGHKMPVLSMDVSDDGLMLATGSADKTIKLWGMDFGDCRRSIRAHEESVLAVKFQPNTHYLFSGSRDGSLKYWDCDKFEFVASLEGQSGEVWALAVSEDGEFIASASRDRLMRVWRRTDEQLFLEEEQDRRMDDMFESTLLDEDNKEARKARSSVVGFMENRAKGEALSAGKRSLETVKAGEKLMEAVELGEAEVRRADDDPNDAPNPMLMGMSADDYVLRALEQIKSPELDEALSLLPLDQATTLLRYCVRLLDKSCLRGRLATELLSRTVLFLFKVHHSQIIAGAVERQLVSKLRDALHAQLNELRSRFGFNASGLSFWNLELADRDDAPFRDAAAIVHNLRKKTEFARLGKRAKVA
jgi:U3 small nucleolar RNA-associated protein 12